MRRAEIRMAGRKAGILKEDDHAYSFRYDRAYLREEDAHAISLSLPLREAPYEDKRLFPFFDGLIPEGWLLDIAEQTWKLDPRDRMGLLLACCRDCIGAVYLGRNGGKLHPQASRGSVSRDAGAGTSDDAYGTGLWNPDRRVRSDPP